MDATEGVFHASGDKQKKPSPRVTRGRILDALEAGADGYLLKHSEPEVILAGIREVMTGGSPLDPKAARVLLTQRRATSSAEQGVHLTGREREVAVLLTEALSNRQIAARLVLSERTVESHVRSILAKTQCANRTEFVARWTPS